MIKDVETLLRKHEELLDGKKAEKYRKVTPDENQTGKDLFKQLAKANRILKDADDNVSKYSKGKSLSDLQEDKTYKLLIDIRDRAQSSSNAHHYIVEEVEDKILPKLLEEIKSNNMIITYELGIRDALINFMLDDDIDKTHTRYLIQGIENQLGDFNRRVQNRGVKNFLPVTYEDLIRNHELAINAKLVDIKVKAP